MTGEAIDIQERRIRRRASLSLVPPVSPPPSPTPLQGRKKGNAGKGGNVNRRRRVSESKEEKEPQRRSFISRSPSLPSMSLISRSPSLPSASHPPPPLRTRPSPRHHCSTTNSTTNLTTILTTILTTNLDHYFNHYFPSPAPAPSSTPPPPPPIGARPPPYRTRRATNLTTISTADLTAHRRVCLAKKYPASYPRSGAASMLRRRPVF